MGNIYILILINSVLYSSQWVMSIVSVVRVSAHLGEVTSRSILLNL